MPKSKGRSRRDKSPKVSEIPSGRQDDRSKSASRPKTRRNPKDMPRQASQSAGRQQSQVSCDVNSYEQHEYLQFSLRITEDIIKNDLYDNEQMKRVLASHFEANKGRLDSDKMIAALYELCLELNIPIAESLDKESAIIVQNVPTQTAKNANECEQKTSPCICPERKVSDPTDPCLCMIERKPPIPCLIHPSSCALQLSGAESLEIKILKSPEKPKTKKMCIEISSPYLNCSTESPEIQILHPPKESLPSIEAFDKSSVKLLCECGSDNCIRDACEKTITRRSDKYFPDNASSIVSEKTTSNFSVVNEEEGREEQEEKSVHIISDERIEEIPVAENSVFQLEEEEEGEGEGEVEDQHVITDCNLAQLVEEYDKKIIHPKHIQELNISHYSANIEPVKVDTSDLNIQTSVIKLQSMACLESDGRRTKLSVSRGTQSTSHCNESSPQRVVMIPPSPPKQKVFPPNDFIVLEGPVFIPKTMINKSVDSSVYSQTVHPATSNVNHPSHTNSVHKTYHHEQPNFDMYLHPSCDRCEPCRASTVYNKPASYSRQFHECDITPQREISMYDNMSCKHAPNSSCCVRSDNLLLGNNYSRYSMGNNHNNISHFYPTIATQVSSTDILNTRPGKNVRNEVIETSGNREGFSSDTVGMSENDFSRKSTKSSFSGSPESKSIVPEFEIDVLEKLKNMPNMPAMNDSTDSMTKRIESLRMDMNKFRDGETVLSSMPRSPQEPLQRERGVSISEEVEMIKEYDTSSKKASTMNNR